MRFFFLASPPDREQGSWSPPAALRRHLRALRLGPEESFLLLPPQGDGWKARLREDGDLEIEGIGQRPSLSLLPVTLATAWPKGGRADELVRRATESGATRIIPLRTARSVTGRQAFGDGKTERWTRIMEEVASQCRRPELPTLESEPWSLAELREWWSRPSPGPRLAATLTPGTPPLQLRLELSRPREVLLAIGPEGGFDATEEAELAAAGFLSCGLTPTILRIEAAGPLAVGLCQHHGLRGKPD